MTYKEFLDSQSIINEEQFNEIVNEFSEVNFEDIYWEDLDVNSVCQEVINEFLTLYDDEAYVDYADFDSKTFTILDIVDIENLHKIKQSLKNWTISNYEEVEEWCKEHCKEHEEELEKEEKNKIMDSLFDKVPLEDLKQFAKKYDQK